MVGAECQRAQPGLKKSTLGANKDSRVCVGRQTNLIQYTALIPFEPLLLPLNFCFL